MTNQQATLETSEQKGSSWPVVGLSVIGFCVTLSLLCLTAASMTASSDKPVAIFAGDSFTGNYRFDEGERLQDLVSADMNGSMQVLNHAKPGARTLDIYMQVHQALWFHPRVDAVIIPLQISKLMPWESPARMDKRGDNLKWWNIDLQSPLWDSFDEEYRKKVLIHKIGLLTGFIDMIEYGFVTYIQSPRERAEMRENRKSRQEKIKRKIQDIAKHWDETPNVKSEVFDSRAARDLAMLIAELKGRNIPTLIAIIPAGNPEIVRTQFSGRAQQNIEDARQFTLSWCKENGVEYVDLSTSLPGESYDDFGHLNGVRGNQMIASAVAQWLGGIP